MTDPQSIFDKAMREAAPAINADGAMNIGWVVVAEWVDVEGRYWLTRWDDGSMPPWRADGLLTYATQDGEGETRVGGFDDDDEDGEDEDDE